ncbi:MAG: hypothetical protein WA880_07725 [Ornithinimicrobium sp.]
MTIAAGGWSNQAHGDKVREAIVRRVEWREFGDGATPVRDDHFLPGLHTIDVLTQTILQIANPDL